MENVNAGRGAVRCIALLGLLCHKAIVESVKVAVHRLVRAYRNGSHQSRSFPDVQLVSVLLAVFLPHLAQAIELTTFDERPTEMNSVSQLRPTSIKYGGVVVRRDFQLGAYFRSDGEKPITAFLAALPPQSSHATQNAQCSTKNNGKKIAHKLVAVALGVALAFLIAGEGGDRGLRLFNRAFDVADDVAEWVRHWRNGRPNENKISDRAASATSQTEKGK